MLTKLLWLFILVGCGAETAPDIVITYGLEDSTVNAKEVKLQISAANAPGYRFRLNGENFEATGLNLDQLYDLREETKLTYTNEGVYEAGIQIFRANGTPYISSKFDWQYSTVVPKKPIAAFSEEATSDEDVIIRLAGIKDLASTELYVDGDLATEPFYADVSDTLNVPIKLSDGDGIKHISINYRNVFGTEGPTLSMSILRKGTGAVTCQSAVSSTYTQDGNVRIQVKATDSYPTDFIVTGDAEDENVLHRFSSLATRNIKVVNKNGQASIAIVVQDLTGASCHVGRYTIHFSDSFSMYGLDIEDNAFFTTEADVNLNLYYPDLNGEAVEMYIYGDVSPAANTFAWVPYAATATVALSESEGPRFVRVKYRLSNTETNAYVKGIFLRPYFYINGGPTSYQLAIAEVTGLTSLTITGCSETYTEIAPATTVSCTKNAASATVLFKFSDGSSTSRTVNF